MSRHKKNWRHKTKPQKHKPRRLVLEAKPDERFILFDSLSGLSTTLKTYYRDNGALALAFEAPSDVRISRETQRSAGYDSEKSE